MTTLLLRCAATGLAVLLLQDPAAGQAVARESFPLRPDGGIPVWLIAGPFEQGTQGFGLFADVDAVGESTAAPVEGRAEQSRGVSGGSVTWFPQSPGADGYLDLNASIGWTTLSMLPEQLWWTRAAYAYCTILSPAERVVTLLCGSNSELRIFLNGVRVHAMDGARTARADQDTVKLRLTKGENRLLVKIANSHQNHKFDFFGGNPWGWGGFFRIVDGGGERVSDLVCVVGISGNAPPGTLISTFFFRQGTNALLQRFDVVFRSSLRQAGPARLSLEFGGRHESVMFPSAGFGLQRVPVYLPAPLRAAPVRCTVTIGGASLTWVDTLRPRPRYELHLVMQSHTDIGYTNPQPVVKEMHCATLDSVVARCERDPEFCWNIETVWQLKLYQQSRATAAFERLMRLVASGRVSVSPFFSNPYTGWVSEEEMIRSMYDRRGYEQRYHFHATSGVYNDVPGLVWFLPQLCAASGIDFLVCGLNEVYGGYTLQKSLPKAFLWEGPDGSSLLTYRTELYTEGGAYGLDRDTATIPYRMWDRLSRLEASGYNYPLVLLNSVFLDNGGVAAHQVAAAKAWNASNAYPRFVFSTPPKFAAAFRRVAGKTLPTVRGDWTSTWDVLFQGEPSRVVRERWAQQQITSAEKFSTLSALLDPGTLPLSGEIARAYESLLMYSGHGSGLEAGYGTPGENAITMDYREQYVRDAALLTKEVLLRSLTRLVNREVAFEREGIIVFNPLFWRCDVPVTLELRDSGDVQYEIAEMGSSLMLPSFREGHRLYFNAPGLPPFGFKKFSLRQAGSRRPEPGSGLAFGLRTLENQHFRVAFEPRTGKIVSIRGLKTGVELVDSSSALGFSEPLREVPFGGRPNERMVPANVAVRVIDQRPARLILEVVREGDLFERSTFTLRNGSDRLEIAHAVNLQRLAEPSSAEMYGVAFPVLRGSVRCEAEILGSTFDPDRDRFPGITHEGFSLRRAVSLTDDHSTVMIASPDCRVFFWKTEPAGRRKTLVANLVNNFPRAWNRNEENRGTLEFRFVVAAEDGPFDPDRAARFGWEACSEPLAQHTLLRSSPAESSFVSVEGRSVVLTTLKPSEDGRGIILRLVNADRLRPATGIVSSPLFRGMTAILCTPLEDPREGGEGLPAAKPGSFTVHLKPNEFVTMRLQPQ